MRMHTCVDVCTCVRMCALCVRARKCACVFKAALVDSSQNY